MNTDTQNKIEKIDVAIVGGGIAGMYSAYKLLVHRPDIHIELFEMSDRLGGKIETIKLDEFYAEFGPMRFEVPIDQSKPGGQELFLKLMDDLGLRNSLKRFTPYATSYMDMGLYNLSKSELRCKDAKGIMKLGIFRLLAYYRTIHPLDDTLVPAEITGIQERHRFAAHFNYEDVNSRQNNIWLSSLNESTYENMRSVAAYVSSKTLKAARLAIHRKNPEMDFSGISGLLPGQLADKNSQSLEVIDLFRLGLWNALSYVLTNEAIKFVKDNGNFYHLLPENPNAIEWIIFWLRGFNPNDELKHFELGAYQIVTRLGEVLNEYVQDGGLKIHKNYELTSINQRDKDAVEMSFLTKEGNRTFTSKHCILALPKFPLQKLGPCLSTIEDLLDAVFGFPLLKCFYVVQNPWWTNNTKVHTRAASIPAREIHYQVNEKGDKGLVLLYTDRPYSEYWKMYVKDKKNHTRAEIYNGACNRVSPDDTAEELSSQPQAKALKSEFDKYLSTRKLSSENRRISFLIHDYWDSLDLPLAEKQLHKRNMDRILDSETDLEAMPGLSERGEPKVLYYGIKDWGLPPYGAACHTWKPGIRSKEVLDKLKAFSLNGDDALLCHICGEAYSNYNGFIEGALSSSDAVLATILDNLYPGFQSGGR